MPYGNIVDAKITQVTKVLLHGTKFTYTVTVEADAIPPFNGVVVAPKARLMKRDLANANGESSVGGTSEQTMILVTGTTTKYRSTFTFMSPDLGTTVIMAYVKANWQVPVIDEERTAPWTLT